jgi:nicotinamidase/pyrazinamidase
VAGSLREALGDGRVFYDDWFKDEFFGANAARKLKNYYRNESDLIVPFFSAHYQKPWVSMEWEAIREVLAERNNEDAVLPVFMDGTQIEGWDSKHSLGIRKGNHSAKNVADQLLSFYMLVARQPIEPGMKDPQNIFISHYAGDSAELALAREIKKRLQRCRTRIGGEAYRVWLAENELAGSDNWREDIDDGLKKANALIVVMSPQAYKSIYVTYEWSYALGRGIPVIVVMKKKSTVHPRLENHQYLDFTSVGSSQRPWVRLFEELSMKLLRARRMVKKAAEIENLRKEVDVQAAQYTPPVAPSPNPVVPRDTLLIIDVQEDFFREGSLPVIGAETLIDPLNELIEHAKAEGMKIIFSRDWHPRDHRSFMNMSPQGSWPPHCVQNTPGAQFHPRLKIPADAITVSTGTDNQRLGYSAFEDDRLVEEVAARRGGTLYIAGIALEYCVQATALEAARTYGLHVVALKSYVRAAQRDQAAQDQIWDYLQKQGIECIDGLPSFRNSEP